MLWLTTSIVIVKRTDAGDELCLLITVKIRARHVVMYAAFMTKVAVLQTQMMPSRATVSDFLKTLYQLFRFALGAPALNLVERCTLTTDASGWSTLLSWLLS